MLKKLDLKDLNGNVFSMIGQQWMLITAGTAESCNTMTASWGGLGILWGRPVATCYIRPQRYTKGLMDREDYFSLVFLLCSSLPLSVSGGITVVKVQKIKTCNQSHGKDKSYEEHHYRPHICCLLCRLPGLSPGDNSAALLCLHTVIPEQRTAF